MAPEVRHASSGYEILRLQPKHSAALRDITADAEEAAQWAAESYMELADTEGGFILVCERGVEVLGFLAARVAGGQAEILNVGVCRKARRQGIASALLAAALEEFYVADVADVYLEVREANVGAIALYLKLGFVVCGRRKDYYRNPNEDALCLARKLNRRRARTKIPTRPT